MSDEQFLKIFLTDPLLARVIGLEMTRAERQERMVKKILAKLKK